MNVDTEIQYVVKKISWGSIIAGVITVMAISILLSTLGTSLGFSMVEPYDNNPVSGVGTSVLIWSAVSILFSLACGGYIAGRLATNAGMIHGFMVWAISLILAAFFGGMMLTGAVKATGSAIGSAASATGSVISGAGSVAGAGLSGMAQAGEKLFGNMDIDTDLNADQMSNDVVRALRNSNIPSLQPEFMQRQLEGAKNEVSEAVKQIALNPDNMDNIIQSLTDKLKKRVDAVTQDVNRDNVTRALAQNTNMSQDEINQVVDNVIEAKNRTAEVVNQRLNDAQQQIQEARQQYEQLKEEAKQKADEAAAAVAKAALVSFFALLIGCVVTTWAGSCGVKRYRNRIVKRTAPAA